MRIVAIVALIVVLAGSMPAFAQLGSPREFREGGGMLPILLRAVNLTPDQQAKVREIMAAHRTAMQATLEQLRQVQDELADKLFTPGPLRASDLQPQLQRIGQLREQLLQESARISVEVRALMTPEQLAKAAQVKERLKALQSEMQELQQGKP